MMTKVLVYEIKQPRPTYFKASTFSPTYCSPSLAQYLSQAAEGARYNRHTRACRFQKARVELVATSGRYTAI